MLVVRNVDSRYAGHALLRLLVVTEDETQNYSVKSVSYLPICYPCLCLWRGSLQMTRTTPLRRTILQLRQIFFTEASTFIRISFRSVHFARNMMRPRVRS